LAYKYCTENGILSQLLTELKFKELVNMFKLEYNEALAKEVAREEGFEDGIEVGIEKGIEKGIERGIEKGIERGIGRLIERMLRKGKSIESIVDYTDVPINEVLSIKERIAAEA
ncbi:MAG: hypothetical protein LBS21_14480, partial [Clostridiales bacterium]|nr:hypothetical protein [Clostridiales bacterium]